MPLMPAPPMPIMCIFMGLTPSLAARNKPRATSPAAPGVASAAHAPGKPLPRIVVSSNASTRSRSVAADLRVEHQLRSPLLGKVSGVVELVVARSVAGKG